MNVEVLVATMNQYDYSILNKMNIQSDAIIANQSCETNCEIFEYNGKKVKFLTFNERGVGLNRNNALMRASAMYCLIADDDIVYVDNYPDLILETFNDNPQADVILFNLIEENISRYVIKKKHKITWFNFMRYGATRIAFKREAVTKNSIFFNLHFGGGAEHSAGEDVLFLTECLKKKLRIVAVPIPIAYLSEIRESTWFKGYTDKFFKDKGILYYYISKKLSRLLCLQYSLRRKKKLGDKKWLEAYKLMLIGINDEKNKIRKGER